jgi:hypothetical protein
MPGPGLGQDIPPCALEAAASPIACPHPPGSLPRPGPRCLSSPQPLSLTILGSLHMAQKRGEEEEIGQWT